MADVEVLRSDLLALREEVSSLRQQLASALSAGGQSVTREELNRVRPKRRRRRRRRRAGRGERQEGQIKFFVARVGWGFIKDSQGVEHFFHRSALDDVKAHLASGAEVTFEARVGVRGPRAAWVTVTEKGNGTMLADRRRCEEGLLGTSVSTATPPSQLAPP